ncbi:L-threonine 3-dehydrogenase-like [Biomphalaria glabrata]|uniref:L-threonine 3-dehydrogenase-like n=1 Tax=Biomphalaria glabrata TaxID=6526 RepID=A0A9U8ED27_BIOGL|nr:L-threonine 3-dehydrogenase-like [Biomphalaria glabrata]
MSAFQIPQKMKALVKKQEGPSYSYVEIEVPEPGDGEVLIRVDAVAICGSDIALYNWDNVARVIATVPFIPGHECAGTVVKCGPNADIPLGTKVGVENHFFCGSCYQCLNEDGAICLNMGQYGHGKKTQHGGCSEYSIVPAKYLYRLTRDLDAEQIAMLEPLGVAHNAIERLHVRGQDILVIGCGPVGLMAQAVAKALGAKRVVAVDVEDSKLELAKTIGADVTVNSKQTDLKQFIAEFTNGVGMDRVCECSGASAMVNASCSFLRKGGYIGLVGLPKQPLHVENVLQDIIFKALTLKTVHGRLIFHTWEQSEALVADGKINVKAVISHRFPMSQFEEAFKTLFSGEACKIVIDPSK